jgi:hypothetical protein
LAQRSTSFPIIAAAATTNAQGRAELTGKVVLFMEAVLLGWQGLSG